MSWRTVTIDEIKSPERHALAMGPFGSDIKSDNFVRDGVPVIRGMNLTEGRFIDDNFVYVGEAKADELKAAEALPGDLVFTHRGTLGQVSIIPHNARFRRYLVSQSQMKFRCDRGQVDPIYLYYFFRSPGGQHALLANTSTTGVPAISRPLTSLKAISLRLPPLHQQKTIASILGALDDKIELNRRMNKTLEAMARAIFTSWFGDTPAHAAIESADDQEDTFEQSIDVLTGGTPKTSDAEYWNGSIPWFSVGDAPSESDVFVIATNKAITLAGAANSAAKILPPLTTIISARGTVGKCALTAIPMAMNQSCYGLRGHDGRGSYYIYFATRHIVDALQQNGHGSVFNTITRETFRVVGFPLQTVDITLRFDDAVRPFMLRILNNLNESLTLASIRDTLLPKLLSGEIRVRAAETLVETAV